MYKKSRKLLSGGYPRSLVLAADKLCGILDRDAPHSSPDFIVEFLVKTMFVELEKLRDVESLLRLIKRQRTSQS